METIGQVVDMYLPNQTNSPSCLVTIYVLAAPVRHWPSFRRGELEAINQEEGSAVVFWKFIREFLGG
jgi:hypothetical protein